MSPTLLAKLRKFQRTMMITRPIDGDFDRWVVTTERWYRDLASLFKEVRFHERDTETWLAELF